MFSNLSTIRISRTFYPFKVTFNDVGCSVSLERKSCSHYLEKTPDSGDSFHEHGKKAERRCSRKFQKETFPYQESCVGNTEPDVADEEETSGGDVSHTEHAKRKCAPPHVRLSRLTRERSPLLFIRFYLERRRVIRGLVNVFGFGFVVFV